MAWSLTTIKIEGIRGINNDGKPLKLNFRDDAVNSIFASNGVGKSSIFEALSIAIRGNIPKLDELPAAEKARSYYRNCFHTGDEGTIEIGLQETDGTLHGTIKVSLKDNGEVTVSSPDFAQPVDILSELNREFVFLDYQTFQNFIAAPDKRRGQEFSGLLGLSQYSSVRINLEFLANTRSFNNTFETKTRAQKIAQLQQIIGRNNVAIHEDIAKLTGKKAEEFETADEIELAAISVLKTISAITELCKEKTIFQIEFEKCLAEISKAEGGEDQKKYEQIIKEIASLKKLIGVKIGNEAFNALAGFAKELEDALEKTQGKSILEALTASKTVLENQFWTNKNQCPVCDQISSESVLDKISAKIELFDEVAAAEKKLSDAITETGFLALTDLSKSFKKDEEKELADFCKNQNGILTISSEDVILLVAQHQLLFSRVDDKISNLENEQAELEKTLSKSLVADTQKITTVKLISERIEEMSSAQKKLDAAIDELQKITEFKELLDDASSQFSRAEARATARRLEAVKPAAQQLFGDILGKHVKPGFQKSETKPDLTLYLEEFWGKSDLSAVALLSESYRNALAISLYVAAASLYRGAASFILFDDVTSSFDGGHQYALANTIKNRVARPNVADGLQFIFLSHDSLLEKLFISNDLKPDWNHQKIEGVPTLLVSSIATSTNDVRDQTINYLNAGQVSAAAPGVRTFLEATLLRIISKLKIPVPLDFAINDKFKMLGNAIQSIEVAIKLHQAAGSLELEDQQVIDFNTKSMSIISNFIAHYATGSTANMSAPALLLVMEDIAKLERCFQHENPTGSGQYRFFWRLDQKIKP